jgi:hypothetical protein
MDKYYSIADNIDGWFNYKNIIPILEKINSIQKANGNILEIGIHHGKSFIPMLFFLKNDELAVAVDVFEHQIYNYDKSGRGNKSLFINNINIIFNNRHIYSKIRIITADSTRLINNNYLSYVDNNCKYRIISIDGCHTKDATFIDMSNAIQILSDDGIIIIDDYHNISWPGVKEGCDLFMKEHNEYRVFFDRYNKYIICHKNYYNIYKTLIEKYNLGLNKKDQNNTINKPLNNITNYNFIFSTNTNRKFIKNSLKI